MLFRSHAFLRFLGAAARLPETFAIGVRVLDRLSAFAIIELLPRRFAMAHFWKTDFEHPGLYAFLMRHLGEVLTEHGCERLNFQQDLGLSGLRFSKKSYVPAAYLRKYTVLERAASVRPGRRLSIPVLPEAFLASVDPSVFPSEISLRPPTLSSDLMDLVRLHDEHADRRHSGIKLVGGEEEEEEEAATPLREVLGGRGRRE